MEHRQFELNAFLDVIRRDIARGRNVHELPPTLTKIMRKLLSAIPVSLDEPLDGDVAI